MSSPETVLWKKVFEKKDQWKESPKFCEVLFSRAFSSSSKKHQQKSINEMYVFEYKLLLLKLKLRQQFCV